MNNGQLQPPTFQSLVEQLKPDTRRRLMRIFDRFGDVDKAAVNKIIEWAYEKGKSEATTIIDEMVERHQARVAVIAADFPRFGR